MRKRFNSSATRICARDWCAIRARALAEAIARIQQATRRFSKRQVTWFRKEPDVHWLPGFGDDPGILAAALAAL